MTFAIGELLLIVGVVVPTIMLILWKEHSPTVAGMLHHVDLTSGLMTHSGGQQPIISPREDSHD